MAASHDSTVTTTSLFDRLGNPGAKAPIIAKPIQTEAARRYTLSASHCMSVETDTYFGVYTTADHGICLSLIGDNADHATSKLIRNLRTTPLDDEDSISPSAETVAEAVWVAGLMKGIKRPSVRSLDAGEIVMTWISDKYLIDLQFDGSGVFCAYAGYRPNKIVLQTPMSVTSNEIKDRLIPVIEGVLNGTAQVA